MFKTMFKFTLPLVSLFLWMGALLTSCETSTTPFECKDAIGCVTIKPGEPIKIGVLQTLTGATASGGTDQVRTIELVVEQRGDILNYPIDLKVEDDRCSPEGGANGTLRLIADPQIIGILGTNCSGAAITASKIMSEAGLVMVSSANTAPSLTSLGDTAGENFHPGYFRVIYNDAMAAEVAAEFTKWVLGMGKAATIDMSNIYSQNLVKMFTQSFTKRGGEVVFSGSIDSEDTNMIPVLTGVANSDAPLLFFPLGAPEQGAMLVQQARQFLELESGKELMLLGDEALMSEEFLQQVGDDGIGIYIAGPGLIFSPEVRNLEAKYEAKYNQPPVTTLYSFASDATNILLDAIASVAILDPDGTLHIGRQALRDALYSTENFSGLTGTLTCNQFGDCGAFRFNIYRLDDPTAGVKGLSRNVVFNHNY